MSSVSPENGDTGLDHLETLLPTYWSTSFSKICLGMKVDGVTRFLPLHQKADSLYALIGDGQYRATSLGRDAWKKLIGPNASLQRNCNQEGFNSRVSSTVHSRVRVGIISNQEGDCIPLIPLSDLVEEGQDSKTRVETEPCIHRTTETKISRHLDTFSFSKDTELLCSRKKLHATWSNDQALISVMRI